MRLFFDKKFSKICVYRFISNFPDSGDRSISTSTSKRSLSAPACSENTSEESVSSLPSVRRVSPANLPRPSSPMHFLAGLQRPLQPPTSISSASFPISLPDLVRGANSDSNKVSLEFTLQNINAKCKASPKICPHLSPISSHHVTFSSTREIYSS